MDAGFGCYTCPSSDLLSLFPGLSRCEQSLPHTPAATDRVAVCALPSPLSRNCELKAIFPLLFLPQKYKVLALDQSSLSWEVLRSSDHPCQTRGSTDDGEKPTMA